MLPYTEYGLLFDDSQHMRFEIAHGMAQNADNGATTIPTNKWTFACGNYDQSAIRLYVNGIPDGTPTSLTGSIDTNATPLSIGRSSFNYDYFKGRIDEVEISNIARSSDWIKTEYNNQANPALFAYNMTQETRIC